MSRERGAPVILRSRALRRLIQSFGLALGGPSASATLGLHDDLRYLLRSINQRGHSRRADAPLRGTEFRVFSTFGEDGIIQHLLRHVDVLAYQFVEVGVEDYRESNTRFLLHHDKWAGVVLNTTRDHLRFIEESGLAWRYTIETDGDDLLAAEHVLDAQAIAAFVEPSNVTTLLNAASVPTEFGLPSMDIDVVNCWVLDTLDPRSAIVLAEYNGHFGPKAPIRVPHRPDLRRAEAHCSHPYLEGSLAALPLGCPCRILARRPYRAADSAFFVRSDLSTNSITYSR